MTSLKSVFLPVFDSCNKALKQAEFCLFIYLFISILFFFLPSTTYSKSDFLGVMLQSCVQDVFCFLFFCVCVCVCFFFFREPT